VPKNRSLLVVRRIDDDAAQRVPLCRRMKLLSPKAEAQTRPRTVQTGPCRLVVGGGGLRCRCLRTRFASATSICCCSNAASPLSQTTRQLSQSLANFSRLAKTIMHLLKDELMWSLKLTLHRTSAASGFTPKLEESVSRHFYHMTKPP